MEIEPPSAIFFPAKAKLLTIKTFTAPETMMSKVRPQSNLLQQAAIEKVIGWIANNAE